ncbi:MAG TPA: hypothetical protein VNM37_00170, partial [Candidatus Dormibacteraeota bacterium]|nr:hypothetical protein [Candidatus Dormibacteraeota bacterium]
EALADEICARLSAGESLAAICKSPHMPTETKVRTWALNDRADKRGTGAGFKQRYLVAREMGYERMAEQVIEISDADYRMPDGLVDNAAIQQARLRSDNRKWLLAKMLPKRFGDRVTAEVVGDVNAPLLQRIELVAVRPKVIGGVPNEQAHLDTQDEVRARGLPYLDAAADD